MIDICCKKTTLVLFGATFYELTNSTTVNFIKPCQAQ